MKPKKHSDGYKPFKGLKALIKKSAPKKTSASQMDKNQKFLNSKTADEKLFKKIIKGRRVVDDSELFVKSMADVTPLNVTSPSAKVLDKKQKNTPLEIDTDKDVKKSLKKLIQHGVGYQVSDTPEYMEGTGYGVHPEMTRRLHRGDFSIQDHLDLHGLNVPEAQIAFDNFLQESITTGKRAILVIHGRGLSSPNEPVLKSKVSDWLTSGQWRKWIVSFSSARPEDGGAGATYVLLRTKPVKKSQRKGKRITSY